MRFLECNKSWTAYSDVVEAGDEAVLGEHGGRMREKRRPNKPINILAGKLSWCCGRLKCLKGLPLFAEDAWDVCDYVFEGELGLLSRWMGSGERRIVSSILPVDVCCVEN